MSRSGMMSVSASAEFKPILSSSRSRVFQNGSLVIHSVVKSDEGEYLCQVTNSVGSGLSKVIKVTVHVAAHFDTKFRAETVRKGQEARLKCEASGDRPLTIVWTKDKTKVSDPRYEVVQSMTKDATTASEIIIRHSDRRDSALFTCTATNEYGMDQTNLQLIMQGK